MKHSLFLSFLAACISAIPALAFDEKASLKLYSDFDKNADPVVAAEGVSVSQAESLRFVPGLRGQALHFSGEGDTLPALSYSTGEIFESPESTIALWVKPDPNPKGDENRSRFIFRTYSTGEWGKGDTFANLDKWKKLSFNRFDADKKICGAVISSDSIPAGKWTHLAFVRSGGQSRVYVNGYEANYIKTTPLDKEGAIQKNLSVGQSKSDKKSYFAGTVDELKIFDKALNPEDVRDIMNSSVSSGAKLSLYIPFNGKLDPKSQDGNIAYSSDRLIFKPAFAGQGAAFIRYGYDAKSSMGVKKTPGFNADELSLSFYFIPNWDGATDDAIHGFLHCDSGNFTWSLKKTGKNLEFTVGSQTLTAPIAAFKKGVPVNVAAAFSKTEGKIYIAFDGKIAASSDFKIGAVAPAKDSSLVIGDIAGTDMYTKSQAEGVIDELKIASTYVTPENLADFIKVEVSSELAEKTAVPARKVSEKEAALWSLDGAYIEKTESRSRICLNALWRFQLALEPGKYKQSAWQYLAVPGRYSGQETGRSDHQFILRKPDLSMESPVQAWNGRSSYEFFNSCFERAFKADPAWKSKRLNLHFEELSWTGSALLFLNGKLIAELNDSLSYDVPVASELLNYDADNFLQIQITDNGNRWSWRGIKGDVYLEILPLQTIEEPFVKTSVRNSSADFSVLVSNSGNKTEELYLEAELKGEKVPGLLKSRSIAVPAGSTARLTASAVWKDAVRWDFENPYLYSCTLRLKDKDGKTLDEYPTFKFGFREFWIEGKNYYLNGNIVHLRNHDSWQNTTLDYDWCRQYVKLLKKLGYNSVRGDFNDKDMYMDNVMKACDEEGLLFFMNAYGVSQKEYTSWSDPDTRDRLEKRMKSLVLKWRNSPSLVMWYLSVNLLGYGWDYHPLKMCDGYLPAFKQDQFKVCLEAVDILNSYDGTRPYFMQAGGSFGPVINSNAYFCWWPQAERVAWAEEWKKIGTKPLHIIETSFPYRDSFSGMDLRFNTAPKPLQVYENAARYFGDQAYAEPDLNLLNLTENSRTAKRDDIKWAFMSSIRNYDIVNKIHSRLFLDAVRQWRAAGISGICPFAEVEYAFARKSSGASIHEPWSRRVAVKDFRSPGWHPDIVKWGAHIDTDPEKPLPYAKTLAAAFDPYLLFIAGAEKEMTSQAHNYYADDAVHKTVVGINDSLGVKEFTYEWKLEDKNGNPVQQGRSSASLKAGEIKNFSLEFKAPSVKEVSNYTLRLSMLSPEKKEADSFVISVFPAVSMKGQKLNIALYDSKGLTADSLKAIGLECKDAASLKSLDGLDILLIGRESFDENCHALLRKLNLEKHMNAKALNLIVFEQTPEALKSLAIETNEIFARDVFLCPDGATVFPSLSQVNLSSWQGNGSLAPQRQAPAPVTEESVANPFWHWSNMNMISSYPARRPSAGNFKVLMTCGMDLLYSPLFELDSGKGRIVVSQLEISGRKNEPAAARILADLINYAGTTLPVVQKQKISVLAEKAEDKNFVESLGYKAVSAGESSKIIVVRRILSDKELKDLEAAVKSGASALISGDALAVAGNFGLKQEKTSLNSFALTQEGIKLFGKLSMRDSFFRYKVPVSVFSGTDLTALASPALAVEKKLGEGRLIFIGIDDAFLRAQLAKAAKISPASSNYWSETMVYERVSVLYAALLGKLGAESEDMLASLETPAKTLWTMDIAGEWDFRTDPYDKGLSENWAAPDSFSKLNGWRKLNVPGMWENQGVTEANPAIDQSKPQTGYDGFAWYRKSFKIPDAMKGKTLILRIASLDDYDWIYVNGVEIGRTGEETEGYWSAPRNYRIPEKVSASGTLNIAMRIFDARGKGGVNGPLSIQEYSDVKETQALYPYSSRNPASYNTETSNRW